MLKLEFIWKGILFEIVTALSLFVDSNVKKT